MELRLFTNFKSKSSTILDDNFFLTVMRQMLTNEYCRLEVRDSSFRWTIDIEGKRRYNVKISSSSFSDKSIRLDTVRWWGMLWSYWYWKPSQCSLQCSLAINSTIRHRWDIGVEELLRKEILRAARQDFSTGPTLSTYLTLPIINEIVNYLYNKIVTIYTKLKLCYIPKLLHIQNKKQKSI